MESAYSLVSSKSNSTKFTLDSLKTNANVDLYIMGSERVICKAHNINLKLTSQDMANIRNVKFKKCSHIF